MNILWDLDGTLFDTYPPQIDALMEAAEEFGYAADCTELARLCHGTLADAVAHVAAQARVAEEMIVAGYRSRYRSVLVAAQPPFAGVTEALDAVSATGGRNVIVTHRSGVSTEEFVRVHNMRDRFAGWIPGDAGYPRKPDPAMFLAALVAFDMEESATVVVGDRPLDVEGARNAGLTAWAFRFEHPEADMSFDTYAELVRHIAGHG